MIVATAGHVDHGKTALVRALTGVDTDRLPEEKKRGISIDLGFASLMSTDGGPTIGFVDVPGHERFVRNMLAGVFGIDLALLLVATDDGVMPQTEEHLQILDLLSVQRCVVVLSKVDRATPQQVSAVGEQVRELLAPTRFAHADILSVSAHTGVGLPQLRARLLQEAQLVAARCSEGAGFRLAVDRVFSVAGVGTVVTGTVFDGVVNVGDRLVLSPSGREVRVRAIEQNGRRCERATAGSRCGLNLAGVEIGEVSRGQWVLEPHLHNPSTRLEVQLTPSPGSSSTLRHGSEVQVHLGAGHVTGRVNLSGRGSLEPGSTGFAQLVLSTPVSCVHGDRFIVRDPSALRTLGGGVVLDPLAPRRRSSVLRAQRLQALSAGNVQVVLSALERVSPQGVDLDAFGRAFNLTADRLEGLCHAAEITRLGKNPTVGLSTQRVQQLQDAILEALRAFHDSAPGAEGMALGSLRTRATPAVSSATFQAILRELVRLQRVALTGTLARRLDHQVQDSPAERTAWERASPALANAGLQGLTLAELSSVTQVAPALLAVTLARKVRLGLLVRVDEERYCLRGTVDTLAQTLRQMARSLPQGRFTAAQARDHTRLGRQLLIQRMEAMDRLGITRRLGETRIFCEGIEPGRPLH